MVRTDVGAPPNSSGYGSQSWTYELIVVETNEVWATWRGSSSQTPWSADAFGVWNVSWDGDTLVIEYCTSEVEPPRIERVLPRDLPRHAATPAS